MRVEGSGLVEELEEGRAVATPLNPSLFAVNLKN